MFWTIVLLGVTVNSVTYIGQFERVEDCQAALQDLRKQNYKGTCVQFQKKAETLTKK